MQKTTVTCKCHGFFIGNINAKSHMQLEHFEPGLLMMHKEFPTEKQCPNFISGGFNNTSVEVVTNIELVESKNENS